MLPSVHLHSVRLKLLNITRKLGGQDSGVSSLSSQGLSRMQPSLRSKLTNALTAKATDFTAVVSAEQTKPAVNAEEGDLRCGNQVIYASF